MARITHHNDSIITDFGDGIQAYYSNEFITSDGMELLPHLLMQVPFTRVKYNKFGQVRVTPRFTWCYGQFNGEKTARYRGKNFETEVIPDWLNQLRENIEEITGRKFNAVLLNRYVNGTDYINWHKDDESFLDHKMVASISLGEERDFQFKATERGRVHQITLKSGSLFIFDEGLYHSLPKRKRINNVRYNITFRCVNSNNGIGNYYYYNRGS